MNTIRYIKLTSLHSVKKNLKLQMVFHFSGTGAKSS